MWQQKWDNCLKSYTRRGGGHVLILLLLLWVRKEYYDVEEHGKGGGRAKGYGRWIVEYALGVYMILIYTFTIA